MLMCEQSKPLPWQNWSDADNGWHCGLRPAVMLLCDRRYSYRASKTALNQLTKTMAVEFGRRKQKVACILLHPGTVDTDLSAPFQKVH